MAEKSEQRPKRKRMSLGTGLRRRGKELGLSQAEVARRLGIGPERYGFYVRDEREPDFDTLDAICRVLSTTPDGLLGYAPAPFSPGAIEKAKQASGLDDKTIKAVADLLGHLVRPAEEEGSVDEPEPPPKRKRGRRTGTGG